MIDSPAGIKIRIGLALSAEISTLGLLALAAVETASVMFADATPVSDFAPAFWLLCALLSGIVTLALTYSLRSHLDKVWVRALSLPILVPGVTALLVALAGQLFIVVDWLLDALWAALH